MVCGPQFLCFFRCSVNSFGGLDYPTVVSNCVVFFCRMSYPRKHDVFVMFVESSVQHGMNYNVFLVGQGVCVQKYANQLVLLNFLFSNR